MLPLWIVLAILPILGGAERFNCRSRILGAYYADAKSGCKAFHVCVRVAGGGIRDFRFFCPPGTLFHQEAQTCTDWGDDDPLACPADLYDGQFDLYKIGSGYDTKKLSSQGPRDEEAEYGLQRAETGDRRSSQNNGRDSSDLRADHSSDFFSGQRERGRDESASTAAPTTRSPQARQSFRRVTTPRPAPSPTQFTASSPVPQQPSSPQQYEPKRKLVRKRPIHASTLAPTTFAQSTQPLPLNPQENYPQQPFPQKQQKNIQPQQQSFTQPKQQNNFISQQKPQKQQNNFNGQQQPSSKKQQNNNIPSAFSPPQQPLKQQPQQSFNQQPQQNYNQQPQQNFNQQPQQNFNQQPQQNINQQPQQNINQQPQQNYNQQPQQNINQQPQQPLKKQSQKSLNQLAQQSFNQQPQQSFNQQPQQTFSQQPQQNFVQKPQNSFPQQQNFNRGPTQNKQTTPALPVDIPPQYKDEYVEVVRVAPKQPKNRFVPTNPTPNPLLQSSPAQNFNKKDGLVELYNYDSQSTPGVNSQNDNRFKVRNSFNVQDVPREDFAKLNSNNGRSASTSADFNTAATRGFATSTPAYKNYNSVSYEPEKNNFVSFSGAKQNYYSNPTTTPTTTIYTTPANLNTIAYNTNIAFNTIQPANYNSDEDDGQYRLPEGEDDGQYRPELYERELLSGAHSLNIAASGNRLPEDQKAHGKSQAHHKQTSAPRPFRPAPTPSSAPVTVTTRAPEPTYTTTYRAPTVNTQRTFDYIQTYTTTSRPEPPPVQHKQSPVNNGPSNRPVPSTTSAPKAPEARSRPPAPPTLPPPRPTTRKPHFANPAKKQEDSSYDYAYYDSDPGYAEYDHIEEFGRTKSRS